MTETPHPAVAARRRRLQKIRVRIATGAVGLFVAVFSVIYAQLPNATSTSAAAAQTPQSSTATSATTTSSSSSSNSSSSSSNQTTPMTTSQS